MTMTQEQLIDEVKAGITQHGYFLIHVFGEKSPSFTYTIGLTKTYNHPEIIVSGLGQEIAQAVLRNAVDHIKEGTRYQVNQKYEELANLPLAVKMVLPGYINEWLHMAEIYYDGVPFAALQLVWPDPDGRFPWEAEFDTGFEEKPYRPRQFELWAPGVVDPDIENAPAKLCPRCGQPMPDGMQSESRYCDVTICNPCGEAEALVEYSTSLGGKMNAEGEAWLRTQTAMTGRLRRYCQEHGIEWDGPEPEDASSLS